VRHSLVVNVCRARPSPFASPNRALTARPPLLLACETMLRPGTPAPDFEATGHDGRRIRLSEFRGQKNVVLFFYPRDFTPVCTREVCAFRDAREELGGFDAEILGVSTDGEGEHARFAQTHGLTFPLLADESGAIGKRYDVLSGLRSFLNRAARVTYVIDKEGIIRGAIHSELSVGKHLDQVRRVLESLR